MDGAVFGNSASLMCQTTLCCMWNRGQHKAWLQSSRQTRTVFWSEAATCCRCVLLGNLTLQDTRNVDAHQKSVVQQRGRVAQGSGQWSLLPSWLNVAKRGVDW